MEEKTFLLSDEIQSAVSQIKKEIKLLKSWRNPWEGKKKALQIKKALNIAIDYYLSAHTTITLNDFLCYKASEKNKSLLEALNYQRHEKFNRLFIWREIEPKTNTYHNVMQAVAESRQSKIAP